MDSNFIVRCNYCEHIYPEDEIKVIDEDREYCDDCGAEGCFTDLGEYGVISDKVAFPLLESKPDWGQLKARFGLSTLCYFENEIFDFCMNRGAYSEPFQVEDYPLITQWWEGLISTQELIEHYIF